MQTTIERAFLPLAVVLFIMTIASARTTDPVPSADDVVTKMVESYGQRQSERTGESEANSQLRPVQ